MASSIDEQLNLRRTVLEPAEAQRLVPALRGTLDGNVWVYRYEEPSTGWMLSIATHAEPGSGKLSLGGFRIAPLFRTSIPGYDNDVEAINLAIGMEEKVYWSRLIRVGGPRGKRESSRIVGGKCVLLPSADARIGQPHDVALLDFAIAGCRDMEERSGVNITTGQDLGHGIMSDGVTPSISYMHARFRGSVLADTSKPTGEGNYRLTVGVLAGLGIPMSKAHVGLIGCGNIGSHILGRLLESGARVSVLEADPIKSERIAALGVPVWRPERKQEFLRQTMHAVVTNASGGTLDMETVATIAENPAIRAVTGSENLVMPDPSGAAVLRHAHKVFCPTELAGMMGYLTAVEEYLCKQAGEPFEITSMYAPAGRLEEAGRNATEQMMRADFMISFEDAVRAVYLDEGRAAR
jgi:hypothetical protein